MNTNDMDRYFWRTGHRWSGDSRQLREIRGEHRLPGRIALLLLIAGLITGGLLLLRS